MALIECPECGRKVSDKAAACPDCGFPIASSNLSGSVAIKIGDILYASIKGFSGAITWALTTVQVLDSSNNEICEGKIGTIMRFHIEKATHITIKFKQKFGCTLYEGIVKPNCRYELKALPSIIRGKWALDEVDVIDSGF